MSRLFHDAFGAGAPKPKGLGKIGPVPQQPALTPAERAELDLLSPRARKLALMRRAFGADPSVVAREALAAEQAAATAAAPPKSSLAELSDTALGAYVRRMLELQGGE